MKARTRALAPNPQSLVAAAIERSHYPNRLEQRSPEALLPLAEAFLHCPPDVAAYLVLEVLPLTAEVQDRSGLSGDLMMTFERMHALGSVKRVEASYVLAHSLLLAPTLKHARELFTDLGEASGPEAGAVPDHQAGVAVARALERMDPKLMKLICSRS